MELVEYLKIIWRKRTLVTIVTVITVAAAFLVTLYLPPTYIAVSKLRIVKPVAVTDLGVALPTSDSVDFTIYQQLVDDPQFKKETLNVAKLRLGSDALSLRDFNLNVAGIKQTVYFTFSAEAAHPETARVLADEGSQLLIKKTVELEYGKNDVLKKQIPARIELIDKKLVDLRRELAAQSAQPPAAGDSNYAAVLGQISDQIAAAEESRTKYTDIVSQLEINNLAKQGSLQLVYNASEPGSHASPSWLINMITALFVGLFLGASAALLTEVSRTSHEE
jgi:capsular polysaccharide biosynthesis protein